MPRRTKHHHATNCRGRPPPSSSFPRQPSCKAAREEEVLREEEEEETGCGLPATHPWFPGAWFRHRGSPPWFRLVPRHATPHPAPYTASSPLGKLRKRQVLDTHVCSAPCRCTNAPCNCFLLDFREQRILARRKRIQERLATLREGDNAGGKEGENKEEVGKGKQQIIESKRRLFRVKHRTDSDVTSDLRAKLLAEAEQSARHNAAVAMRWADLFSIEVPQDLYQEIERAASSLRENYRVQG
eukprot:gene27433-4733_t